MRIAKFKQLFIIIGLLSSCHDYSKATLEVENYYETVGKKFYFHVGMTGEKMDGTIFICDKKCDVYNSSFWYCSVSDGFVDTVLIDGKFYRTGAAVISYSNLPYLDGKEKICFVTYLFESLNGNTEIEELKKIEERFVGYPIQNFLLEKNSEYMSGGKTISKYQDKKTGYRMAFVINQLETSIRVILYSDYIENVLDECPAITGFLPPPI